MIFGIIKKDPRARVLREHLEVMAGYPDGAFDRTNIYLNGEIGFGCQALPSVPENFSLPVTNDDKTIAVVFQGQLYNLDELQKETRSDVANPARLLLHLYKKYGDGCVKKLNGKFAFAIYDRTNHRIVLGRDRVGIEPLFYFQDSDQVVFSTSLAAIVNLPGVGKTLDYRGLYQFLLFCYNPALFTVFKNVNKLRPGHVLVLENDKAELKRYWELSFAGDKNRDEVEVSQQLLQLMRDAVRVRFDENQKRGIFLSGGMDSSTMVALTSELARDDLSTFSFRCRGESFDESAYAKLMADHYGTRHHLVEYAADDVVLMKEITRLMDEPFGDLGINVASYLLGREAHKEVTLILTGDGGDELYGGHPVYEADKMAERIEKVPRFLLKPVLALAAQLPDSEKKKNLTVKAKRFSLSVNFPRELLSHRWRIYYTPNEMKQLMNDAAWNEVRDYNPYEDIYQFNREADGEDMLSRSLYSDYQTIVGFYLRRMGLLKHLGIDSRFPLLDYRLIEYAATIPSELKIRGMSDTKYIFKRTMENVLPHDIVHRKDKLGHSIPMKNWMRDHPKVKEFVGDVLSESRIKSRGIFNYKFIQNLMTQHQSKKTNFSHRLWALLVLELWFSNKMNS